MKNENFQSRAKLEEKMVLISVQTFSQQRQLVLELQAKTKLNQGN